MLDQRILSDTNMRQDVQEWIRYGYETFPNASKPRFFDLSTQNYTDLSPSTELTLPRLTSYARQNMIILKMFLRSSDVVTVTEAESSSWFTMLGSVGGTGGLCLGLSVMTVFEFLEFFATAFMTYVIFAGGEEEENDEEEGQGGK